ncbi:MAG: hypothetical protein A2Y10_02375 [Planctomycetes bacterium GWF2_41_51]|nr:MAG: hypothetical protein A2Y10_02375 [Planctomycetes bacterium GWF2_41_51]HBG27285.1 hypothetical protein [Phycisphaerales bacterium]
MAVKTITTTYIAKKLGISQATVSNVLNSQHKRRYSPNTQEKVLAAAEELGYNQSLLLRSIKQPLRHIGYAVGGTTSEVSVFMSDISSGIHRAANEKGYVVMVSEPTDNLFDVDQLHKEADERINRLAKLFLSRLIDGMLIDKSRFADEQIELLEKANIPCILINGRVPDMRSPFDRKMHWVSIDHIKGGYIAIKYLLDKGHKQIGLINPYFFDYPGGEGKRNSRCIGYEMAIKEVGLAVEAELMQSCFARKRETVFLAVDKLLALPKLPTALFIGSDHVAALVINYLNQKGIKVPSDISVIGYGNLSIASAVFPTLTTIDVPWAKMGQFGCEMLIDLLEHDKEDSKGIGSHVRILEPTVLEGETVKRI